MGEHDDTIHARDSLIPVLIRRYAEETRGIYKPRLDPREFAAGKEILALPSDWAAIALLALIDATVEYGSSPYRLPGVAGRRLISALLAKKLPISVDRLVLALAPLPGKPFWDRWHSLPMQGIMRAIANGAERTLLSSKARRILQEIGAWVEQGAAASKAPETCSRTIENVLNGGPPPDPPLAITPGEAWADVAIADLSAMVPLQRDDWRRLLEYAATASASRPTRKWLKKSVELVDAIGREPFARTVTKWFSAFPSPRNDHLPHPGVYGGDPNLKITPESANLIKGLAWSCSHLDDGPLVRSVADVVASAFKRIKEFGPRCPKVGNAALYALSAMPGDEPIGQLARLAEQVKQPTGKKNIQQALAMVAGRTGQTLDDLAEIAVPTFGLGTDSSLRRSLGECSAELRVSGSDVSLTWFGPDGKPRKSVPQSAKQHHADAVKELKRCEKDAQKMLAGQRARLERLLATERCWPMPAWRQRYHDHPLIGSMSRRLIWQFQSAGTATSAMWVDGRWMTHDGRAIEPTAESTVRMWHPALVDVDEVRQWRELLQEHRITQPFKQAHREIYLLTEAERQTGTYSNRFAGHILRQHQFVALCEQRGWKTRLQGGWDPGGDPTPPLHLPHWNLQAEFWIEAIQQETSGAGVALYVSTDQVRFRRPDNPQPMPLEQVPPLMFSEMMRDVDLFVGVCSVGNDPTWSDGGPDGRYREYWHEYAFGDLSATAQTRKAVLESLLPALKIRDRVALVGRFLVIRGNLRTYKIHLGSSNIQMEPNDQYLCIVPGRGASAAPSSGNLFLPFEGDGTLAVILSKAFLLAADDTIADPTIVRQIMQ